MNIAAITQQAQQRTCSTAHLLAASPFAQKNPHPFLAETSPDNRGSKLNQIADRMVDKFEKTEALKSRIQRQDIMLEEYISIDFDSDLENMDPEVLELYLAMFEFEERMVHRQKQELMDLRDNLKALDQQIQSYQDIIDGKSDSINGTQKEDALRSLDRIKQIRGEYLQQGAKFLNGYADVRTPDGKYYGRIFQNVFSKNPFAQKQASDWMIDISADDIYAEIDRVIGNASGAGQMFHRGCSRILGALEKLGYGEYKYQHYKNMLADSTDDKRISFVTELLEKVTLDTCTQRQTAAQQNPAKYQQMISL